jgi:hypothetical protein
MLKTVEQVRQEAASQEFADEHFRGRAAELEHKNKGAVKVLMPGRTQPFLAGGECLAAALSRGGKVID